MNKRHWGSNDRLWLIQERQRKRKEERKNKWTTASESSGWRRLDGVNALFNLNWACPSENKCPWIQFVPNHWTAAERSRTISFPHPPCHSCSPELLSQSNKGFQTFLCEPLGYSVSSKKTCSFACIPSCSSLVEAFLYMYYRGVMASKHWFLKAIGLLFLSG